MSFRAILEKLKNKLKGAWTFACATVKRVCPIVAGKVKKLCFKLRDALKKRDLNREMEKNFKNNIRF